ncbi:hypothetical protein BJY00DRAFT_250134 [Aspergillus carlsbadensis]|nr:hypothetical protein BJY00DRAFT_250134 [Aspergillus carlsbadensis]
MAENNFGLTKSIEYLPEDPPIAVWTKLRTSQTKGSGSCDWTELFQPLVHAVGHKETVWARMADNPDVVLLATLWWTTSELRDFEASPSAQLYRETLQREGIIPVSIHETIYGFAHWFQRLKYSFTQIFWVYFPAPVDKSLQSQVSKLVGIRPPAFGPGVPLKEHFQTHLPVLHWATEPEVLHGTEARLLLWPHFWRNRERAEYRHEPYAQKRFIERLEELGPVEWKEEIYDFAKIPKL